MALNTKALKADILSIMSSLPPVKPGETADKAIDDFAEKLAAAITKHVLSATITVPAGQQFLGVDTAGAVTGTITTPTQATIT